MLLLEDLRKLKKCSETSIAFEFFISGILEANLEVLPELNLLIKNEYVTNVIFSK